MASHDELFHDGERPRRGVPPTLVIGGLIIVGLGAFIGQNTQETHVNWLIFDITQPLWMVLLVTAALAIVAAELVTRSLRRRRRKDD